MMVLEVAGEATPAPIRPRLGMGQNRQSTPYSRDIPGAVSRPTLALVDELTRLLIVPSGVTGCGSLALVDELTGATSSGSCPALTSICWPWSTCSANSKESSPRPSMRPTSWGSARTRRARTVVEALEAPAGGSPLGTSPRPSCCPVRSRGPPGGRTLMMVLEVVGRGHPRPQSGH